MIPYKVVDETESHITYEHSTAFTWARYGSLLAALIGIALSQPTLTLVAWVVFMLLLVARLWLGREVSSRVRQALKVSSVQVSGTQWSFRNPTRIRVPKRLPDRA